MLEDGPKGADPAAVTSGEREPERDPKIRTKIPDQRLNETPVGSLGTGKTVSELTLAVAQRSTKCPTVVNPVT